MPHVVRLKIKDVYMYPHSNGNKPVDALLAAGMKHWADVWRRDYGINYRFSISRTSGFPVVAAPVILRGQHYRGLASSGRITLHNAWVPAERRWSDTFWSKDRKSFIQQVGLILHHEVAHYWFRFPSGSHARDTRDLMHAYVGRMLTESLPKMRAKFGSIPRTARQTAAAERRLAAMFAEPLPEVMAEAGPTKDGYCQRVAV